MPKGEAHEELIYKLTSVKDPYSDEARELISTWASYKKKRPMTRLNFFRQVAAAASYQLEPKRLDNLTFLAVKMIVYVTIQIVLNFQNC